MQSDSITQSVKQQIDEIQVGGRNLVLESKYLREKAWATINSFNNAKDHIDVNGIYTIPYKSTATAMTAIKVKPGEIYTVSIDAKTPSIEVTNLFFLIAQYYPSNADGTKPNTGIRNAYESFSADINTEWNRYSFSFTVPNGTVDKPIEWLAVGYRASWSGTETSVLVKLPKIEKGNKATDWTPAPEDMATSEDAQNAQYSADEAKSQAKDASDLAKKNENRITISESTIKQLSDSICTMVKDKNGSTILTQNSSGWQFDLSAVEKNLNNTANEMNKIAGTVTEVDSAIKNLNQTVQDLGKKTAYIVMTTDENGAPCIELGKEDNPFKVRITNTSVDFLEGSSRIAYVNNKALYIEKAIIKNELQIGEGKGFVWQIRANGNMGLRKIG